MNPLHLENFGPIHALPILHYRMEFASLVRLAVEQLQPDCIAVELPRTLEAPVMRAVERLPQVSVVSYEPGGKQTVYLLVEPADPLVEGLRLAREKNVSVAFVDADVDDYPAHDDPIPDPYAVRRIGLGPYYREFVKATSHTLPDTADARREQAMAHRLQSLAENHQRILFICGMAHVARISELFQLPQPPPLERVRRENVRLFHLHPDSCREVLGEFGFVSAIYEWSRGELPPEPPAPPSLRKRFDVFELISGGKQEVREEEALEASILRSSRLLSGPLGPDRQRILYRLFEETARHYKQETGEPVHLWQKRAFFRFSRNCALVEHRLLPDFFELLAAARGCVDENFAYAFWRLATFYPFQKSSTELPTIRLRPEDLGALRRLRFRPRPRREEKKLSSLKFLNRKREKRPGEWLEGFDSPAICSYPPEDLVIEDYGDFLKKKGAKQLSEEESRVEPLTSSLLDGIDLRETVRNIVADGRIYVREHQRVKGGVGGVVVIFDEDRDTKKYPYQMTWLGEHEQESDMAFYATLPTDNVVGPGICRCEYGGFLLSYPPRRMAEVWTDPDYAGTRGKHEVLLLAALDYSREKHIVYVAPKPPRSIFRQFAARIGKKIVYIPLGSLSPVKLKKIRILHILYGHDKRETARDYIW